MQRPPRADVPDVPCGSNGDDMIAVSWGDGSTGVADYAISPLRRITSEVARKHGFSYAQLAGRQRIERLVHARHEALWRCRNETTASLGEIALLFGKDPTGVRYGIEKHEARVKAAAHAKSMA